MNGKTKPLARVRQLLALDQQDLAVVIIYGVALGLLSLAVPIAVQSLVNTVAFGSLIQPLFVLAVLLAVALTGAAVLRALQIWIAEMLQRRLFVRIVSEIGSRLPRVSADALRNRSGPELLNRFFDVFTIQKTVTSLLLGGVDAVLIALVGLVVLAFYHPALLAFDIVLILSAAIVLIPLGRGGTGTSIAESKAKYAVAGWLEEMARHPLSFKVAGGRQLAQLEVENLAKSYLDQRHRHFRVVYRQVVGALAIEVLASVTLLAVGGWLVIERELSIGQLVAAELIVTAVVASIAKLGGKVEIFYDLVAGVDKLGEILDLPLERSQGDNPPRDRDSTIGLRVVDAELSGDSEEQPVSVSFELRPGERLSISADSSTTTDELVDSMFGLDALRAGVVEVDGHDVRDLALPSLRSRIALVRGTELFPGCVFDNLRAANPGLSSEDAWKTLEHVGLYDAVKALPQGLQTPLLGDGAPLSHAQALALTIARAVAIEPSVLVLDRTLDRLAQPTSLALLDKLTKTRICALLVVSDDPSIQDRMDRHIHIATGSPGRTEAA